MPNKRSGTWSNQNIAIRRKLPTSSSSVSSIGCISDWLGGYMDRYSFFSFPYLIFALVYISIWVGTLSMIPKEEVHVICCVFGAIVGWPDIPYCLCEWLGGRKLRRPLPHPHIHPITILSSKRSIVFTSPDCCNTHMRIDLNPSSLVTCRFPREIQYQTNFCHQCSSTYRW